MSVECTPLQLQEEVLSPDFKEAVQLQLGWFNSDQDEEVLRFPSSFEPHERVYIMDEAGKLGLTARESGRNENRHVAITRPVEYVECDKENLQLRESSQNLIHSLLRDLPVKATELTDLQAQVEYPAGVQQPTNASNEQKFKDMNRRQMGKLFNASSAAVTIPTRPQTTDVNYLEARQRLLIWEKRDVILRTIMENQVVIVSGDTGCGKTTQVPQYILEEAAANQSHCFMYVTQPRRIAAIAAAERVSQERGERVGTSVGYQIRLEYRSTQKTVLTYCTNSVLLRALMLAGPHECLEQVTHILIDEVHDREMYSDFLLNILRDILPLKPYLSLVLMTADPDPKKLQSYFHNAPIVHVNGPTVEVPSMFLESVLSSTKYHEKLKYQERKEGAISTEERVYRTNLEAVTSIITRKMKEQSTVFDGRAFPKGLTGRFGQMGLSAEGYQGGGNKVQMLQGNYDSNFEVQSGGEGMYSAELGDILGIGEHHDMQDSSAEVWVSEAMDQAIGVCIEHYNETNFAHVMNLVENEHVSVDYHHTATYMTPLMIAVSKGSLALVERLLNLGADPNIKDLRDKNSFAYAEPNSNIAKLLKEHNCSLISARHSGAEELKLITNKEERAVLETYYRVVDPAKADLDLIFYIISLIMECPHSEGSVLVFLPSYDDIIRLRSMLMQDQNIYHKIHIFMLHSAMQPFEQRKVFRKAPYSIRKIILSTDIAETSLTVDDVMFVIDSGRIEERKYDPQAGINKYAMQWITKKNANYRKSRAGRFTPGVCYHLFSKERYKVLEKAPPPELFKVSLSEIALNTKVLAPHNMPIEEFLCKGIDSPSVPALKKAVGELARQEALTQWEELTTVGKHLSELPIDPHLGKVVLYSVILKCLDPILTIVCSLAYTDPFLRPSDQGMKVCCLQARRRFSIKSQSDHLCSLKAFLGWQKARANGWENQFCYKNFLSLARLEMIEGLRAQIIAQLRSMGFIRQKGGVDIRNLNDNSDKWYIVKACLVGGLYPRLARVDRTTGTLYTSTQTGLQLHNDSVLNLITSKPHATKSEVTGESVGALSSDWLVYDEILPDSAGAPSLRCATAVSALTVALFAGSSGSLEEEEDEENVDKTLVLDDWISLDLPDVEGAMSIKQLRLKFNALYQRRLKTPFSQLTQVDTSILRCIVSALRQEEEQMGATQPSGIAQRPFRPYDHAYHTRYHMPNVAAQTVPFDEIMEAHQHWQMKRGHGHGGGGGGFGGGGGGGFEHHGHQQHQHQQHMMGQGHFGHQQSRGGNAMSGYQDFQFAAAGGAEEQFFGRADYGQHSDWKQYSQPARYFIMKCGSQRNVDESLQNGLWQTSAVTEKKLMEAYASCKNVFLIFSVQTSGHFQGYARMVPPVGGAGGMIPVEWIKRANLPFQRCHHLHNPWNENRKVQIARDGQEVETTVGDNLLRLWEDISSYGNRGGYYRPV